MGLYRSGSAVVPTQTSAGTDGSATLPQVVEFERYTRPCVVYNNTGNGNIIRVKLNATDATDFGGGSSDGAGHFPIKDGEATDVSMGGMVNVQRVSFITTAGGDDLDDVEIHGWSA